MSLDEIVCKTSTRSLGLLFTGFAVANEEPKDCCMAKLACCTPKSACCEADAKLGCCEKGGSTAIRK